MFRRTLLLAAVAVAGLLTALSQRSASAAPTAAATTCPAGVTAPSPYCSGTDATSTAAGATVTAAVTTTTGTPASATLPATPAQLRRCPSPSGGLSGTSLGPLSLGLTFARASELIPRYFQIGYSYDDFCQWRGPGLRAAPATAAIVSRLDPAEPQLAGRIAILLTSNAYYGLDGIHPPEALSTVTKRLDVGPAIRLGPTTWYILHGQLAPGPEANGVLYVRHGVVQEVGLAWATLTTTAGERAFLESFPDEIGTTA